jgi:hypothetical protein
VAGAIDAVEGIADMKPVKWHQLWMPDYATSPP